MTASEQSSVDALQHVPDGSERSEVERPEAVAVANGGNVALHAWRLLTEPLWIVGVAVLCLTVGGVLFRSPWLSLEGKAIDWAQYTVAGLVVPALVLGVPLLWRGWGWSSVAAGPRQRVLAAIGAVGVLALIVASAATYGPKSLWLPLLLATGQTIVMTRPWRRHHARPDWAIVLCTGIAAIIGWTVAMSLLLADFVWTPTLTIGMAVAMIVTSAGVECLATRQALDRDRWRRPSDALALVLLALLSVRTEYMFDVLGELGAWHHIGAWVGAADLVRGGGWLLWDVPSNYGFLNVLAFAALPTATPWQSFYLLQAVAFFCVSGSVYFLLRRKANGWLAWGFALALAIAIPMFAPSYPAFSPDFDPASPVTAMFIFPNWGAYRYLWCVAILIVLVWERTTTPRSRHQAMALLAGCGCWLIGVLWGPDIAVYSTVAWLPAFAVIVWQSAGSGPNRWRWAADWIAVPVGMVFAALGGIAAVYARGLGHGPDWTSYVDFLIGVGSTLAVVVQEPIGPALAIVLGLCLLLIGAFADGLRNGLPTRSLGLWIGLLGTFVAVNMYGFQRGYALLHPAAYLALGIMLMEAIRERAANGWSSFVRSGVMPLLTLTLALPVAGFLASPGAVGDAAASLVTTAGQRFEIEYLIPDADAELQDLLATAGVAVDDPVFYAADWLGNPMPPWRPDGATTGPRVLASPHWTPGHPSLVLGIIPPDRAARYVERFIERRPRSGWLIQSKSGFGATLDQNAYANGLAPWLFDLVVQTHVPTRVVESARWQLIWFEYVGTAPEIVRPDFSWGMPGPLPADIAIDGVPLNEIGEPLVWAAYGPGWRQFSVEAGGRRMQSDATLWLYSPERLAVRLELTPGGRVGRRGLNLIVNGDRSQARPLVVGRPAAVGLVLDPGWNEIVLATEVDLADGTVPIRIEPEQPRTAEAEPLAPSLSPERPARAEADRRAPSGAVGASSGETKRAAGDRVILVSGINIVTDDAVGDD